MPNQIVRLFLKSCIVVAGAGCDGLTIDPVQRAVVDTEAASDTGGSGDTGTVDAGADTTADTTADTGGLGDTGTVTEGCPTGFVRIAPGTFNMGSAAGESGRDTDEFQHSVTITRAYCMQATEVTQGAWLAEMGANPSLFLDCGLDCPVEQVSWWDVVGYANALSLREGLAECYAGSSFAGVECTGYRLPTEAEWEYAARGGTTMATYLGNLSGGVDDCTTAQANLDGIAWWCSNGGSRTNAVGGKIANSFGLYDMLGNVWEWTGDWYGAYSVTATDPLGAGAGAKRVTRGGAWDFYARRARAANRDGVTVDTRSSGLGFRLAKSAL